MPALQVLEAQVWRDSLIAIPDIQTLLDLDGQLPAAYKVFWEHVRDDVPLPYVSTNHILGGKQKDHRYSDTTWKIVGHTGNMDTATDLANAIAQLDKTDPVTTAFPGVCGVTYIEETMPIFDRYQAQNVPLFVVGGLYRMRLFLGAY